uniref:Uncharacterized protein n=1 Tax=Oryza brachyantha TaxID=4533 RepID=J3MYH7_ORYBR
MQAHCRFLQAWNDGWPEEQNRYDCLSYIFSLLLILINNIVITQVFLSMLNNLRAKTAWRRCCGVLHFKKGAGVIECCRHGVVQAAASRRRKREMLLLELRLFTRMQTKSQSGSRQAQA